MSATLPPWARPRYAVLINGGNIDSMVAHYTAAKKRRSDDAYTPGGQAGKRPDRAVTVYAMLARRAFPDVPVYLGGIEASLRRFAHYDYWADRVMPSILESTGADGLMFGMSEHAVIQLANNLKHGKKGADACVACAARPTWRTTRRTSKTRSSARPTRTCAPTKQPMPARSSCSTTSRTMCAAGRFCSATAARAHPEPARPAADHRGDGPRLRPALYAHLSPVV